MPQKNISVGVDIGGTHITCGAVLIREGRLLQETLSRQTFDHTAAPQPILQSWAAALNASLEKIDPDHLAGIGFAIPGPFDYRSGTSKMQHKFKNLYGLHIPSALQPLLKIKSDLPMRFLNDAASFAAGEAWLGKGRGFDRVVVITLGTGFGSAFIEHGAPVVDRPDVPKEGCLWHLPFRDGIADEYFSTGWFAREYEKRTGEKISGVKDLAERAAAEVRIQKLFADFGRNLAECLAPPLRLFGAETLVVGGNIAHALPLFEADLKDGLKQSGVDMPIQVSELEENAALIGSARLLDNKFWERVSAHLPNI